MVEHELDANRRMRELGVNAPEPMDSFEFEDVAVMVLEYLPAFRSLAELPRAQVREHAPGLFAALDTIHDANLAHGDLQRENVLVSEGQLYFIDATKVRDGAIKDARAYDIACALGALEPLIGARGAVEAALRVHDPETLLDAREFLDWVNIRPEHDFDAAALKGEIEKRAS
jgi:tRNA A-37 threonylcarbamoyl transferase component Bud32